jgi:broad specificity phosphatase PhoE
MAAQTSISFIRHGAVYNPEDLYYGRQPGFPLSEEGRREALAVARALQDKSIVAIYSSPLQRAIETAEIIREPHPGLSVRISELLAEVYSPFDGRPRSELIARNWNIYEGVDAPYEQPMDVLHRAQRFVTQVRQEHQGRHVVAVTHGDVIAFMVLWGNGIPITAAYREALRQLRWLPNGYPAPASISTFVYKTTDQDELPSFEHKQIDTTGAH